MRLPRQPGCFGRSSSPAALELINELHHTTKMNNIQIAEKLNQQGFAASRWQVKHARLQRYWKRREFKLDPEEVKARRRRAKRQARAVATTKDGQVMTQARSASGSNEHLGTRLGPAAPPNNAPVGMPNITPVVPSTVELGMHSGAAAMPCCPCHGCRCPCHALATGHYT